MTNVTVFHVLKYQLSMPPTAAEFDNLPDEVFEKLIAHIGIGEGLTRRDLHFYASFYSLNHPQYVNRISETLNKILNEYDDLPRT